MTTDTLARVLRAGIYDRVSTDQQSTARQLRQNRQEAAGIGATVLYEWDDAGKSGDRNARGRDAGRNRVGYADARRVIAGDGLDILIVHDVSRAARDLTLWSETLDMCEDHGVVIRVTSEHMTYDPAVPTHRAHLASASVAAQADNGIKGKLIKSGIQEWHVEQGHPHGRWTYGILREKDPARPRNSWVRDYADPAVAPVVRRIVLAVAAGEQYAEIARALTADGIPTARGAGAWRASTVVKVAGNPAYVGVGIVTEAEHQAATARLNATRGTGRGSGTRAQVHRYSGCLACYKCGAKLRGGQRNGHVDYRCPKRGCVSIPAADVDTFIDLFAIARLSREDAVSLFAGPADPGAVLAARQEARRLQDELDEWLTTDGITPRAYRLKEAEYLPKIAAARRAAQEAATPSALTGLAHTDGAVVAARWRSLTVKARKQAIMALCPFAYVGPGKRDGSTPVEDRVILLPDAE